MSSPIVAIPSLRSRAGIARDRRVALRGWVRTGAFVAIVVAVAWVLATLVYRIGLWTGLG